MKKLMNRIDRFCLLHPRFGIRRLMLYIVIGNIAVYFLTMMDTTGLVYQSLYFSGARASCAARSGGVLTYLLVPGRRTAVFGF